MTHEVACLTPFGAAAPHRKDSCRPVALDSVRSLLSWVRKRPATLACSPSSGSAARASGEGASPAATAAASSSLPAPGLDTRLDRPSCASTTSLSSADRPSPSSISAVYTPARASGSSGRGWAGAAAGPGLRKGEACRGCSRALLACSGAVLVWQQQVRATPGRSLDATWSLRPQMGRRRQRSSFCSTSICGGGAGRRVERLGRDACHAAAARHASV